MKEKEELISSLKSHPQASSSHFNHFKEDMMSRQFWRSSFPSSSNSNLISRLKVIKDWMNPPDKDAPHQDTTDAVAQEAANYYEYLGKLPTRNDINKKATRSLLAELGLWGVERCTSDEIGADITDQEVDKVASHLPEGKSPGPDRIPNEFYRTFSHILAPLLAAAFNEMRHAGELAAGFNDGIVSILYKNMSRI